MNIIKHINTIILSSVFTFTGSVVCAQTGAMVHIVNNLARVGVFVTVPTNEVDPTVGPINAKSQFSFGPYFLAKAPRFTVFDTRNVHVGFGKCNNQGNLNGPDVTVTIDAEKWIDKNVEIICSVKTGMP